MATLVSATSPVRHPDGHRIRQGVPGPAPACEPSPPRDRLATSNQGFYGISEGAVRTQIWIVRKRLGMEASQILQILIVTLFEEAPILRALQRANSEDGLAEGGK
jgi:hypothetical protein